MVFCYGSPSRLTQQYTAGTFRRVCSAHASPSPKNYLQTEWIPKTLYILKDLGLTVTKAQICAGSPAQIGANHIFLPEKWRLGIISAHQSLSGT